MLLHANEVMHLNFWRLDHAGRSGRRLERVRPVQSPFYDKERHKARKIL